MPRLVTREDLLPLEKYATLRASRRKDIIEHKRNRRIQVGPDTCLYFEDFETVRYQIQEMLWIEKGGEAQIEEELAAYNPLIPQGEELVAMMMIEIKSEQERKRALQLRTNIENSVFMRFGEHEVKSTPIHADNRTREDGKTSSVHFIKFLLTSQQISEFCSYGCEIFIFVNHPYYIYQEKFNPQQKKALCLDFTLGRNY